MVRRADDPVRPRSLHRDGFSKDGTIGVLYEAGKAHPYEKTTFARFNLEWLTE